MKKHKKETWRARKAAGEFYFRRRKPEFKGSGIAGGNK